MKKPPNWQRKNYVTKGAYDEACAKTREIKKAVLRGSKSRLAHRLVLREMMDRGEFDRPMVTITRQQLSDALGINFKTVRAAYTALKEEGSIKAIYNSLGGRGNAVTFLFTPPKIVRVSDEEAEELHKNRVTRGKADELMKEFGFKRT